MARRIFTPDELAQNLERKRTTTEGTDKQEVKIDENLETSAEQKHPNLTSSLALVLKQCDESFQNERAIVETIVQDVVEADKTSENIGVPTARPKILAGPVPFEKIEDYLTAFDNIPEPLRNLTLDYTSSLKARGQYPRTFFLGQIRAQTIHEAELLYDAANEFLTHGQIVTALDLISIHGGGILNVPTCGYDRFRTRVEGKTLLQMAGMVGDVNIRGKEAQGEKEDHGAVELLAKAGGVTKEEVSKQLYEVLYSVEAKKLNEERRNNVLNIFKEFAENIFKKELPRRWKFIQEFRAAQASCQPEINKFQKDMLELVSNKTVTSGFLLDSQIFVDVAEWFAQPKNYVDGSVGGSSDTVTDIFWVNGYGFLQRVATARDAQIIRTGFQRIQNNMILPERSLLNLDGTSHFSASSKLGTDYFLGYFRGADGRHFMDSDAGLTTLRWKQLCHAKTDALQNYAIPVQPHCVGEEKAPSNLKRC